jgi:hypothetical protein
MVVIKNTLNLNIIAFYEERKSNSSRGAIQFLYYHSMVNREDYNRNINAML